MGQADGCAPGCAESTEGAGDTGYRRKGQHVGNIYGYRRTANAGIIRYQTIDAGEVLSTEFKYAGSHLVAVTAPIDKDGVIDFDIYRNNLLKIRELAARGKILAADALAAADFI